MKSKREYILIVPLERFCEFFEKEFADIYWDFANDGFVLMYDPPQKGKRRGRLICIHELPRLLNLDEDIRLVSAYCEHARRSLALIVEHPSANICEPGEIRPMLFL